MESVLTENSNNNLETTYVKEVYEEIHRIFQTLVVINGLG